MSGITLHLMMVFRSKEDGRIRVEAHTFTGTELSKRTGGVIESFAQADSEKWELLSASHAFLPFKVGYQL